MSDLYAQLAESREEVARLQRLIDSVASAGQIEQIVAKSTAETEQNEKRGRVLNDLEGLRQGLVNATSSIRELVTQFAQDEGKVATMRSAGNEEQDSGSTGPISHVVDRGGDIKSLQDRLMEENEQLATLKQIYAELKTKNARSSTNVTMLESEITQLRQEALSSEQLNKQIDELTDRNQTLLDEIQRLDEEVYSSNERIEVLKSNVEKAKFLREKLRQEKDETTEESRKRESLRSALIEYELLYNISRLVDEPESKSLGSYSTPSTLSRSTPPPPVAPSSNTHSPLKRKILSTKIAERETRTNIEELRRRNRELVDEINRMKQSVPERLEKMIETYRAAERELGKQVSKQENRVRITEALQEFASSPAKKVRT